MDGQRLWQAHHISLTHNLPRRFHARRKHEENIDDTRPIKPWRKDLG